MIRRRFRGIVRTTIVTAVPWTGLGFVAGMVLRLGLIPNLLAGLSTPFPGGLVAACTIVGATVGVINGLTLSGLILATERGKKIEELRPWRFAAWGAIATAGTLGLVFESPLVAAIGAALGAAAGFVALSAARRARAPQNTVVNPPLSE